MDLFISVLFFDKGELSRELQVLKLLFHLIISFSSHYADNIILIFQVNQDVEWKLINFPCNVHHPIPECCVLCLTHPDLG